ncbi:protein kinase [Actinoplanes missouriensis]|uniref:protein kinase domain-containing protein n=1 Tax=Actinoplanes missouriensis TaxID=1866 RepID=UPI0033F712DF
MADESRGRRQKPTWDPDPGAGPAPEAAAPGVLLPRRLAGLVESPRPFGSAGGAGFLQLARWKETGRTVVIKAFPWTHAMHGDLEKVWQLWRSADERYVTPLLHAEREVIKGGGSEEWCFEATEYHPLGSLNDYAQKLDDKRLSEVQAKTVLAQLTEALHYLHTSIAGSNRSLNLVHCDIKPDNILVRSTDPLDVVLTDFGSARLIMAEQKVATAGLTVAYAAPEARWFRTPKMDWWSLGITMIELLQGFHPYVNPTNLKLLPNHVISKEVGSNPVPFDPGLGPSWVNLFQGLTAFQVEERWSAEKIGRWLEGDYIDVDSSIGPRGEQRSPFTFAGKSLDQPRDLAAEMRKNWTAAAALVIGSEWPDLLHWSRNVDLALRARLDEVTRELIDKRAHVDLIVTETIVRLDRYGPPYYRGERMEPEDLGRLAVRAEKGDREAAELVVALNDSGSLSALGTLHGRLPLLEIHVRWRTALDVALPLTASIPSWIDAIDRTQLLIKTLRAALNDEYARYLRDHVDRLATERAARHTQWFTALINAARSGERTPAMDALVTVCFPLLSRTGRESGTDQQEEAEDDLGVAARTAGFSLRSPAPDPPTVKSVWRVWPRRPDRPVVRPKPWTRRRKLELAAVVWAGTVLPVVAASGVGLATAPVQGLLAGCAFALGAGLLWLAVNLRPSRLRGALFGGWLGMVFGYAVALIALVTVGPVLGAAAGWPAFWTVWTGIVMAATARGAAR